MLAGTLSDPADPKSTPNLHRTLLMMRGRQVTVETSIGNKRSGKLTGVLSRQVVINGITYDQPTEIEFDNDQHDRVDANQLVRIDLVAPKQ